MTTTQSKACDFSYAHYREILTRLKRIGPFRFFDEAPGASSVLLRHDVDYSLETALKMAEIEAEEGVKATYFILLSSPAYDPASPDRLALVRALISNGHAVGLHFEIRPGTDANRSLREECETLSRLAGAAVKAVSIHNPVLAEAQSLPMPEGVVNTYDPVIFKNLPYHSDSNQAWRKGCPCSLPGEDARHLQVLVHPIWWHERSKPALEILDDLVSLLGEGIKPFLRGNNELYGTRSRREDPA